MKNRIVIPTGLQIRIEKLVSAHAKSLKTTEEDARRVVEQAIMQQGIAALEQRVAEEGGA